MGETYGSIPVVFTCRWPSVQGRASGFSRPLGRSVVEQSDNQRNDGCTICTRLCITCAGFGDAMLPKMAPFLCCFLHDSSGESPGSNPAIAIRKSTALLALLPGLILLVGAVSG